MNILLKINIASFIIFFTTPYGTAIEWLNILILLILSFILYLKKIYTYHAFKDTLFILLLTLLFIEALSSLFAYDSLNSIIQWKKDYLKIIIFGLLVILNYKQVSFKFLYKVFSLALLLIGLSNFYQLYSQGHTLNIFSDNFQSIRDLTFNANIVIPIVIYGMLAYYKNIYYLILPTISLALSSIIILFSGSRGALLIFFTILLLFLIYCIIMFFKKKMYNKIFVITIILFVSLLISISTLKDNTMFNSAIQRGVDFNGRDVIFHSLKPMIIDNILFGVGHGPINEDYTIQKYNIQNQYVYTNDQGFLEIGSHNRYIELIRSTGIFSLLIYITILFLFFRRSIIFDDTHNVFNLFSLALMSIVFDHFMIRGLVENLNFSKFYFIMFLYLAVYYNFKNENSLHLSRTTTSKKR